MLNPSALFHRATCLALSLAVVRIYAGTGSVNLTNTKQTIDGFGWSSAWLGSIKDVVMDGL